MMSESGASDMDSYIRFGCEMPLRDFDDLEDAKAYAISALDNAREHMMWVRRVGNPNSNKKCVDLAYKAMDQIRVTASIIEVDRPESMPQPPRPLKQPESTQPLRQSELELATTMLSAIAEEAKDIEAEANSRRRFYFLLRLLLYVVLYACVLVVPVSLQVFNSNRKKLLIFAQSIPFAFESIWGTVERHYRPRHTRFIEIGKSAASIRKAVSAVANTARNYMQYDPDGTPPPNEVQIPLLGKLAMEYYKPSATNDTSIY